MKPMIKKPIKIVRCAGISLMFLFSIAACTPNQSLKVEATDDSTLLSEVSASQGKTAIEETVTKKPTNEKAVTNTAVPTKVVADSTQRANVNKPDQLATPSAINMTVYKDPNCGCCGKWIKHAEKNGFKASVEYPEDFNAVKNKHQVPPDMRSCHTTVIDDYVFEGHIPSKYIQQFLANPPKGAVGLTVPGMPVGSPGMEYQNKFLPYKVFQINEDGITTVYADVTGKKEQFTL